MWRSENCLNVLYGSSSYLASTLQRDGDVFDARFQAFLRKHAYEFVDCTSTPLVESELYDRLPSDDLITNILKRPASRIVSTTLNTPTLEACRSLVQNSIRDNLNDMTSILANIEDYVDPAFRETIRRYWLDDIKPQLSAAASVVVISLLLICNSEHIIKTKKAFLDMMKTLDDANIDDEFLKVIVAMTTKVVG